MSEARGCEGEMHFFLILERAFVIIMKERINSLNNFHHVCSF